MNTIRFATLALVMLATQAHAGTLARGGPGGGSPCRIDATVTAEPGFGVRLRARLVVGDVTVSGLAWSVNGKVAHAGEAVAAEFPGTAEVRLAPIKYQAHGNGLRSMVWHCRGVVVTLLVGIADVGLLP